MFFAVSGPNWVLKLAQIVRRAVLIVKRLIDWAGHVLAVNVCVGMALLIECCTWEFVRFVGHGDS